MSKSRKGQLNGFSAAILALVFAALVLVMGIILQQGITDTASSNEVVTIVNETVTGITNATAVAVGASGNCNFNSFAVVTAINTSNEFLLPAINYTIDGDAGTIVSTETTCLGVNDGDSDFTCSYDLDVTYTYKWGGEACDAGNKTIAGLGTFADFWEIIVLAIVIGIVIGLLLIVFGGRRER